MKDKIELILPAGDLQKVRYAFRYGADAVYLGLEKYSMRKTEVRFSAEEIKEAIGLAHDLGKKVYVTFNIFGHNEHLKNIEEDIKEISSYKPDAFIASDLGIISLIRKNAPKIPIHLSTQQNTTNSEAVKFWKDFGIKRVVLARELSLKEISEIHKTVPDIELEMFIHGAMCISYSGRCLISAYMTGREANLGSCAQPCRWNYNLYLEEKQRPGEFFPIEEHGSGTTLLSSRDLNLINHMDKVLQSGVKGLKVEGRNKSIYYLAVVARTYKRAVLAISEGKYDQKLKKELSDELEKLNFRGYTEGFAFEAAKGGETFTDREPLKKYDFVGEVIRKTEKINDGNLTLIKVFNQIRKNDEVELITPTKTYPGKIRGIFTEEMKEISVINPGKKDQKAYLKLDKTFEEMSLIRKKI